MSQVLHIRLLGTFTFTYDNATLTTVDTPRLQSLLAYLVLHSDSPQQRRHLAFRFWPASTESQALTNLRKQLHYLRRALPKADNFLDVTTQTVHWRPTTAYRLDVAEFEETLTRAQTDEVHKRREALEEALSLYRGDLLPSCYDDWILPARERLYQQFLRAGQQLVRLLEYDEEYTVAIEYARRLQQAEPLSEASYRQLMRLYALNHDRAGALRVYQTCVETLERALGVEPSPATRAIHERVVAMGDDSGPAHNLPAQTTRFIGRQSELHEIAARLDAPACRLLTVVGPGGIGKTRVALEAAWRAVSRPIDFPHGIYYVPLVSVHSGAELVTAIIEALPVTLYSADDPRKQLFDYLSEKELLLLLDNYEHLLEHVGLLSEILKRASRVTLLVTSRERLNLQGEWLLDLRGLPVPSQQAEPDADVTTVDAVRLFLNTVERTRPGASLTASERAAIVHICRLLDGMPLAIEMAASCVRTHSYEQLADKISKDLDLLETSLRDVPTRHRSVRAVFEHSWVLLSEREQRVLAQLSVFRGSFRLEAAGNVVDVPGGGRDAGSIPTILSALVDKSLLQQTAPARYHMHPLLREFATEQLAAQPAATHEVHRRHCDYYTTFLRQRELLLKGRQQRETLEEIAVEIDNVRASWKWAVENVAPAYLDGMLDSLYLFFEIRGWFDEGGRLLERARKRLVSHDVPALSSEFDLLVARLRARQAALCHRRGWYRRAQELLHESISCARRQDTSAARAEIAFCLRWLGAGAVRLDEYDEAQHYLQESVLLHEELEDDWGRVASLITLGNVTRIVGEYTQAREYLETARVLSTEVGDSRKTAEVLNNLGVVAGTQGDYDEACRLFQESLTVRRAIDDTWGVAKVLNNLGKASQLAGDRATATQCFQESLALRKEIGNEFGVAIVLHNLGLVAYEQESFAEAARYVEESLSIRRNIDDRRGIATSLTTLGRIRIAQDAYDDAVSLLHEALTTAQAIRHAPGVLDVLVGVAGLLLARGCTDQTGELLAFVLHHPRSERATKDCALQYLDALNDGAPVRELQHRDPQSSLDEVVADIMPLLASDAGE